MKDIFTPISDYLYTRKRKYINFLLALLPAIILIALSLIFDVNAGVKAIDLYSKFVASQITTIAILLSFSMAYMTIIVTADNKNVDRLKCKKASERNYRKIKGGETQPTLFQILLSGIAYVILCQVIYLFLLIVEGIAEGIVPDSVVKYIVAADVFIITYIFLVLMELVVNIYFVFWKN